MTSSLITRHILYLLSRRSYKCLLDTFPRNNSFSHHKDITRSKLFIFYTAYIIGITKTNHPKSVGTSICQHEILGTLKIPQNFLSRFPVAFDQDHLITCPTRRQQKQYHDVYILEHTLGCPQLKNKGLLSSDLSLYHYGDIGL